jgi:hypothetical protein
MGDRLESQVAVVLAGAAVVYLVLAAIEWACARSRE